MRAVVAALLILIGTGCGTLSNLAGGNLFTKGPKLYGGIRQNAVTMRKGGAHEPYTPIFACLDMPFSLVLDTVVLPVTIPLVLAGEGHPTETYDTIERKIEHARTLSVRFRAVKETGGRPELAADGSLWLKYGNKVRLEMSVRVEDQVLPVHLVCDGTTMRIKVGAAGPIRTVAPDDLEKWYRSVLFTVGVLDNSWLPPGHPLALARGAEVKTKIRYRFNDAPRVGPYIFFANPDLDARRGDGTIIRGIEIDEPRFKGEIELAYDRSTLALVGRTNRSKEDSERTRETYGQFAYDETLEDDLFKIRD